MLRGKDEVLGAIHLLVKLKSILIQVIFWHRAITVR